MPTTIQQIQTLLRTIDVTTADEANLTVTTSGLRTCQRLIDSGGQVSGATAAKDTARADERR